MMQSKTIGIREFVSLGLIATGMKITDDTPVIYFMSLGNAAWMAPIMSSVIIAILMYLTIRTLERYEGHNLVDILFLVFGKVIGWILVFYLFFSLFASLLIDTVIYTDLISTMYFTNTPVIAIFGLIVLICAFSGMMGIGAISSFAWSVIIYLKFFLLVALILAIGNGQLNFIFPFFGYGEMEVLKTSINDISLFDEFFYFSILATLLPTKKDFKKGMWFMLVVVMFELTLAMFAFLAVFDYRSVQLLSYPWHEVIRYISLGFIENVESLFLPFWLLGLTIRFSLYFYLCSRMFGRLFKVSNYRLIIPIFAVLIVFVGMIPEQPTFILTQMRASSVKFFTYPVVLLTIILWATAKFKSRRKKQYAD